MSSFSFAARTILELGKELISSDEVALYELIKNSVDAGSKTIEIRAHILLTKSDFQKALDLLAGEGLRSGQAHPSPSDVLDLIEAAIPASAEIKDKQAFLKVLRKATASRASFEEALRTA